MGLLAMTLATLSGCAQSPLPIAGNFQMTEQKKVRSAGHWQIIAQDAAKEMLKMLDDAGAAANARVSLVAPERPSEFDKAFHELLTTALVQSGRRVSTQEANTLKLTYKAQLVKHESPRPLFAPGSLTMLATGVWVLHAISKESVDVMRAASIGAGALLDFGASLSSGGPTSTELVLTTSASTPDQILARKTDVYYLEEADSNLFNASQATRAMKVVNQ